MSSYVEREGNLYRRFRPEVLMEKEVYDALISAGASEWDVRNSIGKVLSANHNGIIISVGRDVKRILSERDEDQS